MPMNITFRSAAIFSSLSQDRTRRMSKLKCFVVTSYERVCSEVNTEKTAQALLSLREIKGNRSNPPYGNTGINYTYITIF